MKTVCIYEIIYVVGIFALGLATLLSKKVEKIEFGYCWAILMLKLLQDL